MRKSATAPFSRRCGPALVSMAKQDRPARSAQVHHTLLKVVDDRGAQHEDGGAGPIRRLHGRPGSRTRPTLDRDGTAGTAAAPLILVRENTMIACTPSGAALCYLTGSADAQLEHEGHKRPDARSARWTVHRQGLAELVRDLLGVCGCPRDVTCQK